MKFSRTPARSGHPGFDTQGTAGGPVPAGIGGSGRVPAAVPAASSPPRDPWAGLREADVKRNGLFDLLVKADEKLSPLLSALTPNGPPPDLPPMPQAAQNVPLLNQQIAEFLSKRMRPGGTQDV